MLFVNKIYVRFKNQEISKEEAVSHLLAEIFKSPRYYCMEQLPEDEISNFLIWIHPHIPKMLDNYKNSGSTFLTYYTSIVRLRYKSWKRLNIKQQYFQNILDTQQYLDYTEPNEKKVTVCELPPDYNSSDDMNINLREPLTKKQAITLLVLSLKSYYLLTNEVTETIPTLTGISTKEFDHYLKVIEEKMRDKLEIHKHLENRVNMSYIICQQYALELSNMAEESYQYDVISRKYENQKKKLEYLRHRHKTFNLKPSNKMVEDVLNLPEGSVRRILAGAGKSIDQIRELLDLKKE